MNINVTPTITWLEIGWVVLSLYIALRGVGWIVSQWQPRSRLTSRQGPSMAAADLLMSIGYYALTAGALNAIAGIAAMFTGPNPATSPVSQQAFNIVPIVATSCICAALVALAVFMNMIEAYYRRLVEIFIKREAEAAQHGDDIRRLETVAASAVKGLEDVANAQLAKEGKEPFTPLAPVRPEHHSPTTDVQRNQGMYQTLMARVVAARLLLDLPLMEEENANAH
jgi:hypothetical protein